VWSGAHGGLVVSRAEAPRAACLYGYLDTGRTGHDHETGGGCGWGAAPRRPVRRGDGTPPYRYTIPARTPGPARARAARTVDSRVRNCVAQNGGVGRTAKSEVRLYTTVHTLAKKCLERSAGVQAMRAGPRPLQYAGATRS
jgi:hypothetical protein